MRTAEPERVPVSEGPCHPWAAHPRAAPCCFTGWTSACTTCSWEGPGKFPESLRLLSTTAIPSAVFSLAGLPGSSVTTLTHIGPGASRAGRLSTFILRITCCVFSDLLDTPQGLAVSCPPLFLTPWHLLKNRTPAWLWGLAFDWTGLPPGADGQHH